MTEVFEWRSAPLADFAVIGDPIGHSLSPQMFNAAFKAVGLYYKYVAIHVPVGEVDKALDLLADWRYLGVNITVPHKETAMNWVKSVDSLASKIGAINTINLRTREGINTDAGGLLDVLSQCQVPLNSKVLVLGAGGSARAALVALTDAGYQVNAYNRTKSKLEALVDELRVPVTILSEPDLSSVDVVVNATSASLTGDSLNLDWSRSNPGTVAFDLAYGDSETVFIKEAKRAKLRTVDGKTLLVAQGVRSFRFLLVPEPPVNVMKIAIGLESI